MEITFICKLLMGRGKEQMKQPSKPTRAQKEIISKHGLIPNNWNVIFESKTDLEIVSRRSGQKRVLSKS